MACSWQGTESGQQDKTLLLFSTKEWSGCCCDSPGAAWALHPRVAQPRSLCAPGGWPGTCSSTHLSPMALGVSPPFTPQKPPGRPWAGGLPARSAQQHWWCHTTMWVHPWHCPLLRNHGAQGTATGLEPISSQTAPERSLKSLVLALNIYLENNYSTPDLTRFLKEFQPYKNYPHTFAKCTAFNLLLMYSEKPKSQPCFCFLLPPLQLRQLPSFKKHAIKKMQ